jgi:hypothetical protein
VAAGPALTPSQDERLRLLDHLATAGVGSTT